MPQGPAGRTQTELPGPPHPRHDPAKAMRHQDRDSNINQQFKGYCAAGTARLWDRGVRPRPSSGTPRSCSCLLICARLWISLSSRTHVPSVDRRSAESVTPPDFRDRDGRDGCDSCHRPVPCDRQDGAARPSSFVRRAACSISARPNSCAGSGYKPCTARYTQSSQLDWSNRYLHHKRHFADCH